MSITVSDVQSHNSVQPVAKWLKVQISNNLIIKSYHKTLFKKINVNDSYTTNQIRSRAHNSDVTRVALPF